MAICAAISETDKRSVRIFKKRNRIFFLIMFLPLVLYLRGIIGGFVWDDRTYFIENDILPNLRPWQLSDIFFHPSNFWGEHLPVRDFLYVLEYNLFGLSPVGYHIVSLGLYILTGYILYFFLVRLYSDTVYKELSSATGPYDAEISASIATVFFLVHPSNVEAVAYISGQKDLLVVLFSFLSIYFLWRYLNSQNGKRRFLFWGVLTYYFAFLSKLAAISLFFILPVLWLISNKELRLKWRKALFLWGALNVPVAVWILISMNIMNYHTGMSQFADIDIYDRAIRAFKMFGFYSLHAIKPFPLSFGYPFDDSAVFNKYFWTGIAVFAVLFGLIIRRRRDIVFFASSGYILFLFPSLQLFGRFIYNASIYDRYLFIALLSACILFERGFASIFLKAKQLRFYAAAVLIAVMTIFSVITALYVPTFHSDIDSTRNSYEKFPDWPSGAFNYVSSLIEAGRLEEAWDITMREKTFASPSWVRSYFKGWIYLQQGKLEQAIQTLSYSSVFTVNEGYFPFPSVPLGRALMRLGRYEEAVQEFRRALSSEIYQPLEMYHARKELEKIKSLRR